MDLSVLFSSGTYETAGWNATSTDHTTPFILLKTEKAINLFSVVVFASLVQKQGNIKTGKVGEKSVWSIRTD